MVTKPAKVEDFIWRRIDDEIVVIKDDGLELHVLNKTAAHIWELCDGTRDTGEIAASLSERFDVSTAEACADVEEAIENLEKLGLVVVQQEEGEVGQP